MVPNTVSSQATHMDINTLAVDQQFSDNYLLKQAIGRQTKTGKPYVALTISDRTGSLDGILWDTHIEQMPYHVGDVYRVTGVIGTYNTTLQINNIRLSPVSPDENDPSLYREGIPEDFAAIKTEFTSYLSAITDPVWSAIVNTLIQDHWEAFTHAPAAKFVHHAMENGLLYHTTCMLRLANSLADLYPTLNRQLLFAAISLHDLGKTQELTGTDAIEYTTVGSLVGHISLVDQMITVTADKLGVPKNDERLIVLHHCVLAHHGKLEYGSPTPPQTLEAQIIHMIDNVDATMMQLNTALSKVQPGQFTEKLFGLDGRKFYKPIYTFE